MHNWHMIAGYVAGLFAASSYLFYLYGTVRSGIRPQRATWFIWSSVAILLLLGLLAKGERTMIWIPWAYAVGSSIIFATSIFYGVGGWSKLDRWCIACAVTSIVVWRILGTPEMPILINLVADLMGAFPTIIKSWRQPETEHNVGWILFTAGNLFNLLAVEHWNLANGSYTVYMFTVCTLITLFAYRRATLHRRVRNK